MNRPRSWCWGLYGFMVFWALGFSFLVWRHLQIEARRVFVEQHKTLLHHAAVNLSDVLASEELLLAQASVRRLAGDPGARYAVLSDRSGRPAAADGALPSAEQEKILVGRMAAGAEARVYEVAAVPAFFEFSESVWVRGERWGALRWGVGAEDLSSTSRRQAFRIFLTWMWVVLVGAAPVFFAARRLERGDGGESA
ncbi:MAG TPA: hypothetical protein P5079_07770 [Elusimicrobiota bacterium]|nr:hypothetical protein [Elusimicrobiota bacterium]